MSSCSVDHHTNLSERSTPEIVESFLTGRVGVIAAATTAPASSSTFAATHTVPEQDLVLDFFLGLERAGVHPATQDRERLDGGGLEQGETSFDLVLHLHSDFERDLDVRFTLLKRIDLVARGLHSSASSPSSGER